MALKNTQIPITMTEYNKKMEKIIDMGLPVHEALVALINEASKYTITKHISQKGRKVKNEQKKS